MHDNVTRLANLPLISVCLVRGRAIGGGAELTLSTDFRVFAPTGRLNFVQAKLGVLPGWAGGSKLVKALEIFKACGDFPGSLLLLVSCDFFTDTIYFRTKQLLLSALCCPHRTQIESKIVTIDQRVF